MRAFVIGSAVVVLLSGYGLALAQDSPPTFDFSAEPENPVLARGAAEDWDADCGTMFAPQVIEHDGTFHLFYTGSCQRGGRPAAIGYASSPDGVHWSKSAANPIIAPDGTGHDAMCVSVAAPLVDGDTWVLYYAANSQPCAGPGQHIARATSADPGGDWQRDERPVLEAGDDGDWDAGFIMPHAVLRVDDTYVMYYSAGEEYLVPLPRFVGMATSEDGIHWTKYDDPATMDEPYATSDPVLKLDDDGTTAPLAVWALDVLQDDNGWEMFYSGTCPNAAEQTCPGFIAYAHSDDGIHWRTAITPEHRALTPQSVDQPWAAHCVCYPSIIHRDERYWLYFTGCADAMNDCQIGLATGVMRQHE